LLALGQMELELVPFKLLALGQMELELMP